jgi:hypothetical protein
MWELPALVKLSGGPHDLSSRLAALAADKDFWWIGTGGDGLIRISKSGNAPQVWTESDGLFMPAISAPCRQSDRLTIHSTRGTNEFGALPLR